MAIYEDGKLKGKLGNVVYRTVNGKTVVQSYPQRPKDGYKLTEKNAEFALAAKAASRLYWQLKDFALNLTMRSLQNSLTGIFMKEYQHLQPAERSEDWLLLPGSTDLKVGSRNWINDLVDGEIDMWMEEGECKLRIPPLKLQGGRFAKYRIWQEVREMEMVFTLLHYDFEMDSASVVERWSSGRFSKNDAPGRLKLDFDLLDWDDELIDKGLLLGSVGLRLYASEMSDAYLNTAGFNPFSVLGGWVKG